MKLALGLAVCTLLAAAVVWAQADKTDFAEYQGWMKSNAARQSRNTNDGVRFALDATYGLAQVDVLISQGKFDEAAAALKTAQASCGNCHMAHRDKAADGSFRIKMK